MIARKLQDHHKAQFNKAIKAKQNKKRYKKVIKNKRSFTKHNKQQLNLIPFLNNRYLLSRKKSKCFNVALAK
jgi:hypothetical protein